MKKRLQAFFWPPKSLLNWLLIGSVLLLLILVVVLAISAFPQLSQTLGIDIGQGLHAEQPMMASSQPQSLLPAVTGAETPATSLAPGKPAFTLQPGNTQPGELPNYRIHLDIDLEALAYQGEMYLDYVNREDTSLDSLFFRLLPNGKASFGDGSLTVTLVEVNGMPVAPSLSVQDTALQVPLPASLQTGQATILRFLFEGKIPRDFGLPGSPSGYGIFNYADSVLALSAFYPMLSVYDHGAWSLNLPSSIGDSIFSDCANYSVSITLPEDIHVAATGLEMKGEIADGNQTLIYESGPARDFFLIASPYFEKTSHRVDGTLVNVFYLPGQQASAKQALSVAVESLKIFNRRFGSYPYTELDVVEAPMRYALGVEFPEIILISSDLFKTPEKPEFVVTVAHEVAHQWWYNVVGNDVFMEPWLDEGLVTYASSLYYEFGPMRSVPTTLIDFWQGRVDQLVSNGQDEMITQPLEYFENLEDSRIYGSVVYMKAALFFYELRQEIGDEAFFLALQNYYQDNRFQIATAQDLLTAFEAASGRSLQAFYQQELYSE